MQGVVGVVDPMLTGAYEGWTEVNPGCTKMGPLELDDAGKARKDGIRNERKKFFRSKKGD